LLRFPGIVKIKVASESPFPYKVTLEPGIMKTDYLVIGLKNIPNPNLLVNVVSRRVRQLGQGHRPLVETEAGMTYMDVALKEIALGKLQYEVEPMPEIAVRTRKKPARRAPRAS
jgi:DNA-directed RNA polymerase subunit omega